MRKLKYSLKEVIITRLAVKVKNSYLYTSAILKYVDYREFIHL